MNKLILGVTAVTVLAGCLDPKYGNDGGQEPVKTPTSKPAVVEPAPVTPVEPIHAVDVDEPSPFEVVTAPEPVKPLPPPPPAVVAPATTTYIIQRGDTISSISARYNIRQDAILAANPKIKDVNKIRLGQKIQLPGKVDVGEQTVPEGAFKAPAKPKAKPASKPYTGETKDYTVQKGDVLGTIARKHGCTVLQLKEMNGMTKDVVYAGKKIKVPASAPAKAEPAKAAAKPATPPPAPKPVEDVVKTADAAEPAQVEAPVVEPAVEKPAETAVEEATEEYTVGEGEDIANIAILFNVRPNEIRQLNNLPDDAELVPGMKIKLPASSLQ